MAAVHQTVSYEDFQLQISQLPQGLLALVHLYSPWTEFKSNNAPQFSKLASKYRANTISFIAVNTKSIPEVHRQYEIKTAPRILLLRDGTLLEAIQGIDFDAVEATVARNADIERLPGMTQEQIYEQIASIVAKQPLMLFMKGTPQQPRCRFSMRMVKLRAKHNVDYGSFDVLEDEDIRMHVKEYGEWPTFPQLWANGAVIGGCGCGERIVFYKRYQS
ncbi:hypothetical protein VHEMI06773 [[Torrubiella] hemipterigena]|uniref:Thioredoxin domain-containing protein n=1 Tax=[Torrubiella] hemipterigena TaxID=1531966 RepID=A0A0A1T1I7_9HYPO|nr:hypothetical protein VHEMI06773 [[Torrubiella] hemipterigena]